MEYSKMASPKCFISYSHESEEHKEWVRNLASKFVENKVTVFLDQWDLKYGHDLPSYMETRIRESDFILLICTPVFAEKANNGDGGVGYEKGIITGEIYQNIHSPTKFIPVLKDGNDVKSLPSYLKGKLYADFRDDSKFEEVFQDILRHIFNDPKYVKPSTNKVNHSSNAVVESSNGKTERFTKLCQFAMQRYPKGFDLYQKEEVVAFANEYVKKYTNSQTIQFINLCQFAMQRYPAGLDLYQKEEVIAFATEYVKSYNETQTLQFINLCQFAMQRYPKGFDLYQKEEIIAFANEYVKRYNKTQTIQFINLCRFALQRYPTGLDLYQKEEVVAFANEYVKRYDKPQTLQFINLCQFAMRRYPNGLDLYNKEEIIAFANKNMS